MLAFEDKLYIRSRKFRPNPFAVIDKRTLRVTELTEEEVNRLKPKEGKDKRSLFWSSGEEDDEMLRKRTLGDTPFFTDGTLVYVITKVQDEREEDQKNLVVESYDPARNWCFVRAVTLYDNGYKDRFTLKSWTLNIGIQCATNGETLMIIQENNQHFFNLKTGVRFYTADYESDRCVTMFDHNSGYFVELS